ncbi:MAG TPA: amidohydrolase family protein [Mycobacterium sp.]
MTAATVSTKVESGYYASQYRVIDTDTHVIEPPDLWTSRMPSKWGDMRPHVAWSEAWGEERWRVGDKWLNPVAAYSQGGWKDYPPSHPGSLDESIEGGHDANARLRTMDEYGLYAQVLYPNMIGFDSQAFFTLPEPEAALDCVRAYNDFLTDFASADPNRLLPISMLPFWDVDASVKEMKRCREMGHRGILWAAKLHVLGFPRIVRKEWDPVYAAAQDLDMSVNLHIGIGAFTEDDLQAVRDDPRKGGKFSAAAYVVDTAGSFTSNMQTIGTLLVSDLFERFPKLKMVSVESGFGYLPYLLESLDWQWKNSSGPRTYPNRRLPSEKFFSNVLATFWFEHRTLELLNLMPEYADNLMFETDFPHATSITPGPASSADLPKVMLDQNMQGLPDDVVEKILHSNAAKLYHVK